jgi:hypothetical protein
MNFNQASLDGLQVSQSERHRYYIKGAVLRRDSQSIAFHEPDRKSGGANLPKTYREHRMAEVESNSGHSSPQLQREISRSTTKVESECAGLEPVRQLLDDKPPPSFVDVER